MSAILTYWCNGFILFSFFSFLFSFLFSQLYARMLHTKFSPNPYRGLWKVALNYFAILVIMTLLCIGAKLFCKLGRCRDTSYHVWSKSIETAMTRSRLRIFMTTTSGTLVRGSFISSLVKTHTAVRAKGSFKDFHDVGHYCKFVHRSGISFANLRGIDSGMLYTMFGQNPS